MSGTSTIDGPLGNLNVARNITEDEELRLKALVESLLDKSSDTITQEKRGEERTPFFCVSELTLDGEFPITMPVYMRDISASGIGFVHSMPLESQEATVAFLADDGQTHRVRINIQWCRECDDQSYLSGARMMYIVD